MNNTKEMGVEEVKHATRQILQVIVSEWPEHNIMTGKERNALFDGIKPILHQELQKAREQRKGWKGYVVVDPKADNYKYSPIYMDRREATLWLAENGDDDLEVAEVDILLADQSELDQPLLENK